MQRVFKACAPPACSCPELEIHENLEGMDVVIISDDYSGMVYMTIEEFTILATDFLNREK